MFKVEGANKLMEEREGNWDTLITENKEVEYWYGGGAGNIETMRKLHSTTASDKLKMLEV